MRLVLDTLFLETLEFSVSIENWAGSRIKPSREEVLRTALESVGIELIDYGSYFVSTSHDKTEMITIMVFSRAYRERAERAAAQR